MRVLAAALSATLAMGLQQAQQAPPAQQPPEVVQTPPRVSNDPRVNLKPGMRDAGHAIKGMELVAAVPKPASPPPLEMTVRCAWESSATTCFSIWRKAGSPAWAKMSAIVRPARGDDVVPSRDDFVERLVPPDRYEAAVTFRSTPSQG